MTELSFTPFAQDKYNSLTDRQQSYVDQSLDGLKREDNGFVQHVADVESGLTILFEHLNSVILVTDIVKSK